MCLSNKCTSLNISICITRKRYVKIFTMQFLITFGNLIVYSRFKYELDMLIVFHFHFDIFLKPYISNQVFLILNKSHFKMEIFFCYLKPENISSLMKFKKLLFIFLIHDFIAFFTSKTWNTYHYLKVLSLLTLMAFL